MRFGYNPFPFVYFKVIFALLSSGIGAFSYGQTAPAQLEYLKTTRLYEKARSHDTESMYNLGLIYYYGDGKAYIYSSEDGRDIPVRDFREAFYWFKKASENGHLDSLYHWALLNLLAPERDFDLSSLGANQRDGFFAMETAAKRGHMLAQAEMTKLAETEEDIIYWEEKAAENGHIPSQYHSAIRKWNSEEPKAQKQAVEWFFDFVGKNTGKFGIYSLGHIAQAYLDGRGLSPDPVKAYAYQSLYVQYYPACDDTEEFRQELLAEYAKQGELNSQDIEDGLLIAMEIKREIENKTSAQLQRPFSSCGD